MLGFGTTEIILIASFLVVFFGAKKVPEIVRGTGEAIKHIKSGFSDEPKDNK